MIKCVSLCLPDKEWMKRGFVAVDMLTLSLPCSRHVRSCQFQTPPLSLPPCGDVITLGVPHFLTLREQELGAEEEVGASEEVFKQEHMCLPSLYLGAGSPIMHIS